MAEGVVVEVTSDFRPFRLIVSSIERGEVVVVVE